MDTDTRAFQETFRYKRSSVHCSSFELTSCACSGRQICWQTFCKLKKGIDPEGHCAQTELSINEYTCA